MRALAPVLVLAPVCLVLTGCGLFGEKDKENLRKACGPAPAALASAPTLPGSFPTATGFTYTGVRKDGPTTVASGYVAGTTIGEAHTLFATTLKQAAGYQVTHEEQDVADAEVNFAGHAQSGQVKMVQGCKDRTTVTVTIRPA